MLAFGPVPSRRLGFSLGINNIPPKTCSYACVYCQVGQTLRMTITRQAFYSPEEILQAVTQKLEEARAAQAPVDYLSFVPDGEPTLDIHLGQEIRQLQRVTGKKVAVISNASLIWREDVQADLKQADWVSLKVDAVQESVWRRVNRPHHQLSLDKILAGIQQFAKDYSGQLVTETMLVRGVNDTEEALKATVAFLAQVQPVKAYLAMPTRPPAESWVQPPEASTLSLACQLFRRNLNTECLMRYEGSSFRLTGEVEEDLLSIVAVHPMREEAALAFLKQAGVEKRLLDKLVAEGKIAKVEYEGAYFYVRRFSKPKQKL